MKTKIKNLYDFLRLVFPEMTLKEGLAVWYLLQNSHLYAIGKEEDINGSFRYNGGKIAMVTGIGDYMTYYCSCPVEDVTNSLFKKKYTFTYRFAKRVAGKILKSPYLNKIIIDRSFTYALLWDKIEHPKLIKIGQIKRMHTTERYLLKELIEEYRKVIHDGQEIAEKKLPKVHVSGTEKN